LGGFDERPEERLGGRVREDGLSMLHVVSDSHFLAFRDIPQFLTKSDTEPDNGVHHN